MLEDSVPVGAPVDIIAAEPTPESARAALIDALDTLIGELQTADTYCGMNIDVHRFNGGEQDGMIACIQLVPVDMVLGNAARRVE